LTVLRALREGMPAENFIYLGDTAGSLTAPRARNGRALSLQCAAALIRRQVRCLVVACNTASASALDALRLRHPTLPVIGGHRSRARKRRLPLPVRSTLPSSRPKARSAGALCQTAIHRLNPSAAHVPGVSLFVSMAEEG